MERVTARGHLPTEQLRDVHSTRREGVDCDDQQLQGTVQWQNAPPTPNGHKRRARYIRRLRGRADPSLMRPSRDIDALYLRGCVVIGSAWPALMQTKTI